MRQDNRDLFTDYPAAGRFVMASNVGPAQEYYPQLEGALRVLVAPSFEKLADLAQSAEENSVPYDALGYGLERGRHTTAEELADLPASTQLGAELATQYGKTLVMGPGFGLMSEHESDYPKMSAFADVWILQSQRLQIHPPGETYRQEVKRVIDLIRAGNPDIEIWVSISVTPGPTVLSADEWLAYYNSIVDLPDGIFVYDGRDPNRPETARAIYAAICGQDG
jgi:hypothetical protein